jgi:predicted Zn-dependent protease
MVLALAVTLPPEPLFASPTPSSKRSQSDRDINAIGHREIVRGKDRSLYLPEKEKEVGAELSAEVDRSARLVHDPSVTAYLAALTQNIAGDSDAQMPIMVTVIDTDEVNACTSPGGYQYITRGLLLLLESEGELAGVLAHGIAYTRIVKQFGRLRGRRMSAKIALSRRMEPLQTEADRNSGFKHYTLRNWALSGA